MTKRKTTNTPGQLIEGILNEYDEQCDFLEEFTLVTHRLILDLIKSNNLRVHSVTYRVKDRKSISDKINKSAEDKYHCLDDIEDICGNRIITYFPDEVDAVAAIIQNEFDIDYNSSVDKRAILDPDRFGYLSLHYIAKLSKQRLRLTEYTRFKKCRTEIQIRSILQHTWAEIEHDLGYKTKLAVPRHIRRRFSQLAGLLELADDTFVQIRNTLSDYESNVSDRIKKTPESVQIDQASLLTFVKQSKVLVQIDRQIALRTRGVPYTKTIADYVAVQIPKLDYINIKNIAELSDHLNVHKDRIIKLAVAFLSKPEAKEFLPYPFIRKGTGINYLFYLLVLQRSPNFEAFAQELINAGLPSQLITSRPHFLEALFASYQQK
jgi:putative GTP pyrophosphokinase